jgi:predicted ABC-type ATPase
MKNVILFAGPNGAGKTRLSIKLKEENTLKRVPFNFDLFDKRIFAKCVDNPYNPAFYEFAKEEQWDIFESDINTSMDQNLDFYYESNYREIDPTNKPTIFKKNGYTTTLFFIALDSIETSKKRATNRFKNEQGIYLEEDSIKLNFKCGLENLDKTFEFWDRLVFINNSIDIETKTNASNFDNVIVFRNGKITYCNSINVLSEEVKFYLPNITKRLNLFIEENNSNSFIESKIEPNNLDSYFQQIEHTGEWSNRELLRNSILKYPSWDNVKTYYKENYTI